jgi:hypothetical protein
MPTTILQPTANTTPNGSGSAVTSPSNTGHGSTFTSDPIGPGNAVKTCRWSGFASAGAIVTSMRLQFSWGITAGSVTDGGNSFAVEYSLNGGSNWISAVSRADVTDPDSGSVDIALPTSQDATQVQVRDNLTATAAGAPATITASVSGIQLEVITQASAQLLVMM